MSSQKKSNAPAATKMLLPGTTAHEVTELELRKWAKLRGLFIHPECALMIKTQTMGYGVFARTLIPKGQTLLACPHSVYISPVDQSVSEAPAASAIDRAPKESEIADYSRTVLRLMAEVIRNDGPWKQWLACCPSMPDHLFDVGLPLNPSPSSVGIFGVPPEIAAKIGSNPDATPLIPVSGVAQQLLAIDINKKWESVQELLNTNPSIWKGTNEELHALFLECCAQVSSRNFHRESQERPGPFLLPTIDFLNHSQERSNVSFIIHGGGGGKKHVSFDVMAKRDIQPKEQLFHDYGSLSASRFLVEFQFVSHEKALKQDITLQFSLQAAATTFAILACTSPATSIFVNGKAHDSKNWSLESNVKPAQASGVNDNFMYFLNRSLFRVNKLVQSDMIFYEEGLMLVDEETMALARVGDAAKEERRETMKSTRFRTEALRVALFLLTVDDASFDVLYSKVITRYWQVGDLFKSSRELKKTAAGVNFMTNVLGIPAEPDCVDSVVPSATETSKVASLASMNGKPIRTDDTLLNVMDTHILLPFLQVRQSITEFQAGTIEKAEKPGPFRTERTGTMVAQVLRHEARIIQAEIDAAIKLAEARNDIV